MHKQKTLYIIRHGKSTWDYFNISDIDRPLKEKGIKNSYEMANRLNLLNVKPEIIMSSSAARAVSTALVFSRVLGVSNSNLYINDDIYMAGEYEMLDIINDFDDKYASVMLFGHNPTFTDLANHYAKDPIDDMPTAGMVTLKFEAESWKDISKKNVIFENCDYPKKR